jgi:hypothetical protein
MKTKVQTYEGVDIYRVNVRGLVFYKSALVFGEALTGDTIEEVSKRITSKLAAGDTRKLVMTHETVNIYEVREGSRTYYISDPLYDDTIVGDTTHDVALDITRKHAMSGWS